MIIYPNISTFASCSYLAALASLLLTHWSTFSTLLMAPLPGAECGGCAELENMTGQHDCNNPGQHSRKRRNIILLKGANKYIQYIYI